jgi:uncharacterized membrane protein
MISFFYAICLTFFVKYNSFCTLNFASLVYVKLIQFKVSMTQAHLHLFITHLPIFASAIGGLVLAYALYSRSIHTKIAAFFILVLSSIGAIVSYLTGESAEELAENIPGVAESSIGAHEESAYISLLLLVLLGVSALVGLFLSYKKPVFTKNISLFTLILTFICFFQICRTGYLGGKIRHFELNEKNYDKVNLNLEEDPNN